MHPRALALIAIAACTTPPPPFPRSPAPPPAADAPAPPAVDAGAPVEASALIDAAPALSGPALSVEAVAVVDGIVPWTWLDRVEGPCGYRPVTHVEGIDVATGQPRWTAPAWQRVLGQLPDGDVVVASGGALAVLGRRDGAVRFQCAPPADSQGDDADWRQAAGRLHVTPFTREVPSGAARPYQLPPPLPFTITITATGCAAGPDVPTRTMPARLPPPAFSYVDGAWTVRVDQRTPALAPEARPQPVQPTAALIGERGGAVRWRRTLTVAAVGPCALP
ncbi:MAG: hypothetical protein JNK64_40480 [Myxococcales bacterium]|nr:hypothetical protein [Myxococcales bacterium]